MLSKVIVWMELLKDKYLGLQMVALKVLDWATSRVFEKDSESVLSRVIVLMGLLKDKY